LRALPVTSLSEVPADLTSAGQVKAELDHLQQLGDLREVTGTSRADARHPTRNCR
jgi:hypothetical protein